MGSVEIPSGHCEEYCEKSNPKVGEYLICYRLTSYAEALAFWFSHILSIRIRIK